MRMARFSFLAFFNQWREFRFDAAQLGLVLVVGVFLDREFFGIGEVAGIDADFFHPLHRFHRGVGLEVNVSDDGNVAAAFPKFGDDILKIRGVFDGWRGDADDLAADRD